MELCSHGTAVLFMSDLTQRNTHQHLFRTMPIPQESHFFNFWLEIPTAHKCSFSVRRQF